jgi:hypothetical protein
MGPRTKRTAASRRAAARTAEVATPAPRRQAEAPAPRLRAEALAERRRSEVPVERPPGRRGLGAASAAAATPLEAEVRLVDDRGVVHATLAGGEAVVARCPAHVDRAWLQAAARVAPVDALLVAARPSGRLVLWGIFPGEAHEAVAVDVRIRGRQVRIDAESMQLGTAEAHLRLERDGNVSLRGRDVTSHARRVNRIKGGAVRLN